MNAQGRSVHWEIYDSEIVGVPTNWPTAKNTTVAWDLRRVTIDSQYFDTYQVERRS